MTGSVQGNSPFAQFPKGHWPFLDLLRCAAAILVMLGHTRGLIFVSFQDVTHADLATKAFYFLTGIHREGVAIFFAVSGFLVGGSIWRSMRESRFAPRAYLASRFSRIYLVLLPALALTLLLDWAGRSFLIETRFFGERPLMPIGVTSDWSWGQMACNLAAVQGIFCKPLGANPPLWSLGYEWVFYLLAPMLFGAIFAKLPVLVRAASVALLFMGLAALAGGFAKWLPWLSIWLGGALAAQVARGRDLPLIIGFAGLAAIGAGFLISRLQVLPPVGTDLMVGMGAVLAIATRRLLAWCPLQRSIRMGADCSYSLYLIHVPVTVFVGALIERFGWPSALVRPSAAAYLVFACLATAALAAAWVFAQATERHTDRVRELLLGRRTRRATALPTAV